MPCEWVTVGSGAPEEFGGTLAVCLVSGHITERRGRYEKDLGCR
jgi:hypothetical protein